MHKYHLLSLQQEHLRQRLSLSIPSDHPLSYSSSMSPTSPTSNRSMTSSFASLSPVASHPSPQLPPLTHYRSEPVAHDTHEEERLFEINQQIKATLTELLNTASVKHDGSFRAWVQSRLMDAEVELKKQRRRKSCHEREKEAQAESIATHFECPFKLHYRASI